MPKFSMLFLFVFLITQINFAQPYKILESNDKNIKIEFNFNGIYHLKDTTIESHTYQMIKGGVLSARNSGEPWLPEYNLNIAIPFDSKPTIEIIQTVKNSFNNKMIIPFPSENEEFNQINVNNFDKAVYSLNRPFPEQPAEFGSAFIVRYSNIITLKVSPYQYNPVSHELVFNKKVILNVLFNSVISPNSQIDDHFLNSYLKSSVINYSQALKWTQKSKSDLVNGPAAMGNYWYDPNKNYFKIYLKNKGVYRLSFDQLVAAGVPIQGGVESDKLELINEGNSVPLDVVDGGDAIFNSGDYLKFVGYPSSPTPYCKTDIYNNSNIYWFSYQSDTLSSRYSYNDGFPNNYQSTLNSTLKTLQFEKDSIYEPLGRASSGNIDHWYWDKVYGSHGVETYAFTDRFQNLPNFVDGSHYLKVQVNLTGMNTYGCSPDHIASFRLNDHSIGTLVWDGQSNATFQKIVFVSSDSIPIYSNGNYLTIATNGENCDASQSDELRMNWYSLEYWGFNRTLGNHFDFTSPPDSNGVIRFLVWQWTKDNMKIYVPSKNKCIVNPQIINDQDKSVLFVDTVNSRTEYFCASSDYFLNVDSIVEDVPADLRNLSNEADYIIITHPDFMEAALRLKALRENQYPDSGITEPHVKIVDINQIYDEFSYGLLKPQALRDFVSYAFNNWKSPAPAYVVLLGDMSHDYRQLLPTSRPNFIPSLPYFVYPYGIAPSDNLIVDVAGNDLAPDLAIGRLSCETPAEAGILLDKLENYPQDNTKYWKEDVMLAASGLSADDEPHYHFNLYSNSLANTYLIPNGIHPSRIFNFPTNHQDSMYIGGGLKIRQEIDEGVVVGNYYGHGGGYQWDLIFTSDDIAALNNPGRLPLILSVTCYTAHFDDQDVFGEQFNKLPGKGSIGFFGNTVLTYWPIGAIIDEAIFNQIFNNRNYVVGKALFEAKNDVSGGYYDSQITLLTYLGDPGLKLALPDKPDFVITPSDISLSVNNPLANDTTQIKVKIRNLGVTFPNDSVNVQIFASTADTGYLVSTNKLPNFGEEDSVIVDWVPTESALYTIRVEVNELDPIPEEDHSDNIDSSSFVVYNISQANVLYPQDGFSTSDTNIKFRFVDIGHYLDLNLTYFIEIDTSLNFSPPMDSSGAVAPADGLLDWVSPKLIPNVYFWRVRIDDGVNKGEWSSTRSFSIMNNPVPGFYSHSNGLKMFNSYNVNYSDSLGSLILNTSLLPPHPSNERFIDDIELNDAVFDTVGQTAITTDGTYIYFANIWYYAEQRDPGGKSMIYKVGTGYNGTIKGQFYGALPDFNERIGNSIVYCTDGNIYATINDPYHLRFINPLTGDTGTVDVPPGLLNWETGRPTPGSFYLKFDGEYMYNLTLFDSSGNNKYVLRTLDPFNNWQKVKPDLEMSSRSYSGFSDFFAADDYIYPTEYYESNLMRNIRISDGAYEEEWIIFSPFQRYYAWCYDWDHNVVIAAKYPGYGTPKFSRFQGSYIDSKGRFTTQDIGPASAWNNISYNFYQNSSGIFSNILLGLNRTTKNYDTLAVNIPNNYSLENISSTDYKYLKLFVNMKDTTFNTSNPLQFKDLHVDYDGLPEIMVTKNDLYVSPDSVLQGLNSTVHLSLKNIGFVPADSVSVKVYFNDSDSAIFNSVVDLAPDSSASIQHTFSTTPYILDNSMKEVAHYPKSEYFTFDNVIQKPFFIVRDSTNPVFNITFDGKEIINGDLVSAKPEVVITLKDNSPLPLDTSYFTLIHTNDGVANILHFSDPDLNYTYTGYPNSEAKIIWHPALNQGEHILEILAKDASGNFFDSTSYRVTFEVVTEYDLRDVYNYPNPFTNGTYFTFKVTGDKLPDELYVKIYTVAGRLIRTINIPSSALGQNIGFKKIFWDGKDEDGDEIANGVYFYKMIYKVKDVVKSVTQKLAKIK